MVVEGHHSHHTVVAGEEHTEAEFAELNQAVDHLATQEDPSSLQKQLYTEEARRHIKHAVLSNVRGWS